MTLLLKTTVSTHFLGGGSRGRSTSTARRRVELEMVGGLGR